MNQQDAAAIVAQVQALGYGAEAYEVDYSDCWCVRVTEQGRYFISLDRVEDYADFAQRYARAA